MKAALIFTGSGPIVILTSYDSLTDPHLLDRLHHKGLSKFIAFEIPVELCRTRYGRHFDVVCDDLHQADDLRVLDYNGHRALDLFKFEELGQPIFHEAADNEVVPAAPPT